MEQGDRRKPRSAAGRIVSFLLAAVLALACGKKTPAKSSSGDAPGGPRRVTLTAAAAEAAGLRVEAVTARPIEEFLPLAGSLSYDENKVARVGPRIGGRVARILVDFGESVRAGQTLAEIDSPEMGQALAEWRRTRSVFNVRQRDFDRAKKLLEGKAISQGEFLSREGEFNVAKSEMENADSRLHLYGLSHEDLTGLIQGGEVSSQFPLRSPIAGRVIDRQINPGAVVEAGKTLFTVGDIGNLWLIAQLYEKDLARVRQGQAVEVSTEAYPTEVFRGTIDHIADQVDSATRTVRARAVIGNAQGKLKPGMFVEARLQVSSLEPVLAVPAASVQQVDKQSTVFVEVSPNVFEARAIETGRAGKDFLEVRKGLRVGERVVSQGSLTVKAQLLKSTLAEE